MRIDYPLQKHIRIAISRLLHLFFLLLLLGAGGPLLRTARSVAVTPAYRPKDQEANLERVGEYIQRGILARGVYVANDHAYVADWDSGLWVIDVSDPAAPTAVGFYDISGEGKVADVFVAGNHAYVAAGRGMHIIDVSNPARPVRVGFYATARGASSSVYVINNLAYLAAVQLHVVDISDPTSPAAVSVVDIPTFSPRGVFVEGSYAYVATAYAGLRIIDVSNPAAPVEVSAYEMPGVPFLDVDVAGHQAYVAAGGLGLRVIDVSDPAAPDEVGAHATAGYANSVQTDGRYAYVTSDYFVHPTGTRTLAPERVILEVIDVSDPVTLAVVAGYTTTGSAMDVQVAGGYIYVAYGYAGRVGGLLVLRLVEAVVATPSPTGTLSPTPPTATLTLTPISTPTATGTPTATVTLTPVSTSTVTPTATATPEPAQSVVYLPYVSRSYRR